MSKRLPYEYPRLLSIAGSDSSGGAGIQADLKTWTALGCYGMTAITAITAQNTQGVQTVHTVPAEMLRAQIDAVAQDLAPHAIKIGMLPDAAAMLTVAAAIDRHAWHTVVLDTVMQASSGGASGRLMAPAALAVLVGQLFGRATLVTPNLDEASALLGRPVENTQDMASAAHDMLALGAKAVLLKGGHLPGDEVCDVLVTVSGGMHWMRAERIPSHNSHGTGCTLSAAIAAHLALGACLHDAVEAARAYVRGALAAGASAATGQGQGPLNHGYAPQAMHLLPIAPKN